MGNHGREVGIRVGRQVERMAVMQTRPAVSHGGRGGGRRGKGAGRVGGIECSDFRYILKREPTEFLEGVNMRCEEREK